MQKKTKFIIVGFLFLFLQLILICALVIVSINPSKVEEEGKKTVAKRPEVLALYEKYGRHVHVKALDIEYVEDLAFLNSIHPRFNEETGCIIFVHAGDTNEGYVYQENKDLEIIYQETLQEFLTHTRAVDPDTMATFYLSLH
jgi:hypothetical protein